MVRIKINGNAFEIEAKQADPPLRKIRTQQIQRR